MSNQQNILTQTGGSFTLGLEFGGGSTGLTFSNREGRYIKTGNLVNFSLSFTLSNKGSSTGTAKITGLPFTNGAQVGQAALVASFLTLGGSYDTFKGEVDASATTISILQEGSNIVALSVDDTSFANNTFINISGAYFLS